MPRHLLLLGAIFLLAPPIVHAQDRQVRAVVLNLVDMVALKNKTFRTSAQARMRWEGKPTDLTATAVVCYRDVTEGGYAGQTLFGLKIEGEVDGNSTSYLMPVYIKDPKEIAALKGWKFGAKKPIIFRGTIHLDADVHLPIRIENASLVKKEQR